MPLALNALDAIRANLELLRDGDRPKNDMLAMIANALSAQAVAVVHHKMTGIFNQEFRIDAYGSRVQDLAVLELYAKRPKAELFSVTPKGDRKPKERRK